MNELALMDAWIYGRLAANTAIQAACGSRIFRSLAPEDAAEPLIVYEAEPVGDVAFMGAARVQVNADYTIRAVTRGMSFNEANLIADAIDAAIHDAKDTAQGRAIAASRAKPVSYTTTEKDTRFNHAGGVYRLNLAGS
jgi:hypothetical protein